MIQTSEICATMQHASATHNSSQRGTSLGVLAHYRQQYVQKLGHKLGHDVNVRSLPPYSWMQPLFDLLTALNLVACPCSAADLTKVQIGRQLQQHSCLQQH